MPARRQVDTLKQLCVQLIIKNIQKYRTSELHCLPTNILEDMIRFPKDADDWFLSTEKSLHLSDVDRIRLIRQNITHLCLKLDFELILQWTKAQHLDLLNAVLKTSNSLTHFTCNATRTWTQQDFLNLTVSIPNIVVLTLTNALRVNDDILEAIGDNCPKLESLTLKYSEITDEGIRRFCRSKSRGSKLKHLKFSEEEKVTAKGCLIALKNLKQLKVFDYEKVIEAFMKLFQELNVGQYPTFQISKLPQIWMKTLPKGVLNFITKCCPNLSCLDLSLWDENFENDIAEFRKCDLTLPLSMEIGNDLSMSHLTEMGSNVTSLFIGRAHVELDLIGLACPNLKKFTLQFVKFLPLCNLEIKHNQIVFSKLQQLTITLLKEFPPIPIPHFKFLLKHCLELEELRLLGHHNEINDDVMISVLHEINPLKRLTRFNIYCSGAPGMTKVSIMELLKMENSLRYLRILNIIPDDEKIIKSYIKENNYWIVLYS